MKNYNKYLEVKKYLEGIGLSFNFIFYITNEFKEIEKDKNINLYEELKYRLQEESYSCDMDESVGFIRDHYYDIKTIIKTFKLNYLKIMVYENPEVLHINIMLFIYKLIKDIWND